MLLIVLALSSMLFVYSRDQAKKNSAAMAPGLIAVTTPDKGTVPIAAAMIHITAISLGDPSLAIVNGKRVAEGDEVALLSPRSAVAVKLRVRRIADGQVDLTDGTQVLNARLEVPSPSSPKRP